MDFVKTEDHADAALFAPPPEGGVECGYLMEVSYMYYIHISMQFFEKLVYFFPYMLGQCHKQTLRLLF